MATAAQAVAGGLWTQEKAAKHKVAGAESDVCLFCAEAIGSARHRLGCCPAYKRIRDELPWRWQHHIGTAANRWQWDRGLVRDPSMRYEFTPQVEETEWFVDDQADGPTLSGDVATDGSRIGNWRELGMTGWSCAMAKDGEATVLVSLWGPLPHSLPVQRTIARAELFAVRQALRHCLPPLRVHVDCMLILRGVSNGRRWCTFSARPHADIWTDIWSLVDDIGIGPDGVMFFKVAAHVTRAMMDKCSAEEERLIKLNVFADEKAKAGAHLGVNRILEHIGQAVSQRADEVKGALDHIAMLADAVYERDGGWRDVVEAPRGVGERPKLPKLTKAPKRRVHVIEATTFGHRCVECRRVAFSEGGLAALRASECKAHPTSALVLDSLDKFVVVQGHRLWKTGRFVWCACCARHTSRYVRELAAPCTKVLKQPWWRRNLVQGRAPKARKTDPRIGVAARLTVAEWLSWKFMHEGSGQDLEVLGEEPAALAALCEGDGITVVDLVEDEA